jgi:hypothetical protein
MTRKEQLLLTTVLALIALALVGPFVAQPAHHHDFADQRMLAGVPYAMDVLSNLPFAWAGLYGAWLLWRAPAGGISNMQRAMAALFFGGLLVTAAGSAWYHLHPDDAGLVIDRFAMSIAFAGLLGLAVAGRVSERAGAVLGLAVLLLAPVAVQTWAATGNVLPWAVVQFGGVLLIAGLAIVRPLPGALHVRWLLVLLAYGVAKAFEMQDHALYAFTGEWLSGHSMKHLVAALAALPVIAAVREATRRMQNATGIAFAA